MLELLLAYAISLWISENIATEKYNSYCDYLYNSQQVEEYNTLECDVHYEIQRVRSGKY